MFVEYRRDVLFHQCYRALGHHLLFGDRVEFGGFNADDHHNQRGDDSPECR